jgi:hypothetical protein
MKRLRMLTVLLLATLIVLPWHGALAQEEQPDSAELTGGNVAITIKVGDTEPDGGPSERTYRMVALSGGPTASLLMGWRMPIPTSQAAADSDSVTPVVSYVYQNVGMSADIETKVLSDGRLMLRGMIEVSGARAPTESRPELSELPVIGTFQQGLYVVLEDGKWMRIAEVPDPDGGTLYLEIRAEFTN